VSWGISPGFVTWCPLGWNNRAVFGFSHVGGFGSSRWNSWTVVPRHRFGHGFVNVNVINPARIDVRTRSSFVVGEAAPDFRGYAVPRSSAPIRSAGLRSAPGTSASTADDAAAAFRSRRSSTAASTGAAYPAPAREPRAMSSLTVPTRPSAAQSRATAVPSPESRSS
jgi:hypothetical protein